MMVRRFSGAACRNWATTPSGVGDGALGVHEDQQFPEIFPGGLHLPAAEHEHPHEIGDEQGAHHGKQRSPDDTFFHWQDLRK